MNTLEEAKTATTEEIIAKIRMAYPALRLSMLMELATRSGDDDSLLAVVKEIAVKNFDYTIRGAQNITTFGLAGLLIADTPKSRNLYDELLLLWDEKYRRRAEESAKSAAKGYLKGD